MSQLRLLAILAHPDDESFGIGGTLAKYAREGVDVHVCIVTDGAAGSYDPKRVATSDGSGLAQLRRQELMCACRILDVRLHTLDYRDSGMVGTTDNVHPESLYKADLDDVARDLVRVIHRVRPHVIISHDPSGGYFHPDHVKVNLAVNRAWSMLEEAQEAGAHLESRGVQRGAWRPLRLYYTVIPRSQVKWFLRVLRLLRKEPRRFGQNRDIDLTKLGVADEQIHVRLDVAPYGAVKERASACHSSQGGSGALRVIPSILRRGLLRYECFVQALPPGTGVVDDLFQDLEAVE